MGDLAEGVYESLRTAGLEQALDQVDLEPRFTALAAADAPEVLARHVAEVVRRALAEVRNEPARIGLVNELLSLLRDEDALVSEHLEQLVALTRQVAPGVHAVVRGR